jgi:PrtD family type I secretion system ABC transporter
MHMEGDLGMAMSDAVGLVDRKRGGAWRLLLGKTPRRVRRGLLLVAAFSLVSNVLQLALPLYSMQVFDRVLASGSNPTLLALTAIALVFVAAGVLLDALRAQMLVRLGNALELHWREPILKAAFHPARCRSASLGPGSLRDLETVRACVTGPGMAALLDFPWTSFFVLAVFALAPLLGCVTVAAMGLSLVAAAVGETLSGRWGQEGQAGMGEAQRVLEANLADRDAVLSMGGEARVRRRIAALRDRALASGSRSLERLAWSTAAARGFRNVFQVAVLMAAASLVLSERLPAGAIVASSMLFARALGPVERVAAAYRQLRAARDALLRLVTFEDGAADGDKALSLPVLAGRVEVANLTAKRSSAAATALADISFDLRAGEVMAVVGASGAGKSTLARSIVGVTESTGGTVRLDGAAVADWDPEQLGQQVGYLPQEPQLLEGTVAEVIARFGPVDDAKVVMAAQRVGAHEFFLRLPQGYRTAVGRFDHALSAGERQRVALARAFYGDPTLLVLDEPTANLDDQGEKGLWNAVLSAKERGATVIVVSRLISLLKMADHLLMLEKGRVKFLKPHAQVEKHLVPRLVAADGGPDRRVRRVGQG